MSRHSRHRLSEPRRLDSGQRGDSPQPVRLAAPDPARASALPSLSTTPVDSTLVDTAVPPAGPGPLPMTAMHVPTAASEIVVDESAGPPVAGCTPAQLRRFIKSRAYLPVHEIRRRFGIETSDDEVTGFLIETGRVFVGLPQREGRILGELVRAGEVGYELQLDPEAPIIVGVYPMRPVTRQ